MSPSSTTRASAAVLHHVDLERAAHGDTHAAKSQARCRQQSAIDQHAGQARALNIWRRDHPFATPFSVE